MDTLQYNAILFLVLICDIIDSIVRDCLGIAQAQGKANGEGAGYGILAYFLTLSIAIIVSSIAVMWKIRMKFCSRQVVPLILQLMIAALYFFGDNFPSSALAHADFYFCLEECRRKVEVAKQISLGTAIIIIHSMPFLDNNVTCNTGMNVNRWQSFHYSLNVITVLIKIDMIYSIVTAVIHSNTDCTATNMDLTYTFFAISTVIGWISVVIQSVRGKSEIYESRVFPDCCIGLGVFAILIILPMFLLSDNRQLLDCGYDCISFNNSYQNYTSGGCSMVMSRNVTSVGACTTARHSISLAFMSFTSFVIICAILTWRKILYNLQMVELNPPNQYPMFDY